MSRCPEQADEGDAKKLNRTRVKQDTVHPCWDERFKLNVSSLFRQSVVFELRDSDKVNSMDVFSADDKLGSVTVHIASIPFDDPFTAWYPICGQLESGEDATGHLQVGLHLRPVGEDVSSGGDV